jgi:hypothetical protein
VRAVDADAAEEEARGSGSEQAGEERPKGALKKLARAVVG